MNETLVVIVRGVIGFITLFIFCRVLGKQQVSQLTFFDYVVGITIGSITAELSTNLSIRPWSAWMSVFIWTVSALITQWAAIRWRVADKALGGEPTIVIMNGKIMEESMKKMRYRISDLTEQLRGNSVFDIGQVEFAVLEANGQLSVLKKSQYQPVTPKDLNIATQYVGMSSELVFNGIIIEANLKNSNLTRQWLLDELKKKGIADLSEVFFAEINTQGDLYVDTYKDHLKTILDISDFPGPN